MAAIAIDLGGTKLAVALLTGGGRMLHKAVVPLERRGGDAIGELIRRQACAAWEISRQRSLRITGLGACVPGISDARTARVWAPNLPGWTNYPLRRVLTKTDGNSRVPVVIDSDRTCCILGEAWRGAARGCRDAIFLSVGTGIGAGILVDGKVLRGPNGIAGSIGWLALDRPFRSEYKSCGCFEYHASGAGLAKVARALRLSRLPSPTFTWGPGRAARGSELSAAEIIAAYRRGEPEGRAVIGEAIEFWGMAVANLVSLFNPQKIIFGGGVFGPARAFLDQIRIEASKWAQPIAQRQVKLLGSRLGGDAGLYGAGYLALIMARKRGQ